MEQGGVEQGRRDAQKTVWLTTLFWAKTAVVDMKRNGFQTYAEYKSSGIVNKDPATRDRRPVRASAELLTVLLERPSQ
jgi:hypothetical protein